MGLSSEILLISIETLDRNTMFELKNPREESSTTGLNSNSQLEYLETILSLFSEKNKTMHKCQGHIKICISSKHYKKDNLNTENWWPPVRGAVLQKHLSST